MARLPIAVRRLEILEGAMLALKDRGLADLRIRDVAEASGASTATIHYHFSDLGELLLSVHDLATDRFARARVDMVASVPDAREKLRLLAATGLPADEDDALVSALYELHSLHRKYPTHKRLVKALFDQQVDLYASVLEIGVAQQHFRLTLPRARTRRTRRRARGRVRPAHHLPQRIDHAAARRAAAAHVPRRVDRVERARRERGPAVTRARDLGIPVAGEPGPQNALTDVAGLQVGMVTLVDGEGPAAVRTGVTAILPLGRDGIGTAVAAGLFSLNGNGELTGSHWIRETGGLAGPVMLTNTHAVGTVHRGVVEWTNENRPDLAAEWLLPVVGETWDGFLNAIDRDAVTHAHVAEAIDSASATGLVEGSAGGGHRDELLRLQGRHRDRLAPRRVRRHRVHRRGAAAGQLRRPIRAHRRRHPDGRPAGARHPRQRRLARRRPHAGAGRLGLGHRDRR